MKTTRTPPPKELITSDDPARLPEYLSYFEMLAQDIEHWNSMKIFTPRQLAEDLQWQCAINCYKSDHGIKPSWKTLEEASAYLEARNT